MLTFCAADLPFFGDNVTLVSKIALFYYDDHFSNLLLPLAIDSGHPPFYALYMAACWALFGKTLAVSHAAVLPVLVGIGSGYYQVAKYFLPQPVLPFSMLLLLFEPTLLAQSVLAGYDLALMATYLLALVGILYHKRWLLAFCLCVMVLISLRGVIAMVMLGLCDVVFCFWKNGDIGNEFERQSELEVDRVGAPSKNYFKKRNPFLSQKSDENLWSVSKIKTLYALSILLAFLKKTIPAYLPALTLFALWTSYHYQHSGFLFSNPHSTWAAYYEYVDVKGFVWNLGIVGWRFLDFGRVAIWGVILVGLFRGVRLQGVGVRKKERIESRVQRLEESQGAGVRGQGSEKAAFLSKGGSKWVFPLWRGLGGGIFSKIIHTLRMVWKTKAVLLISFWLLPLLVFVPILIVRTVPITHRYFVVFYLLAGIFALLLVDKFFIKKAQQRVSILVICVALLSGHFWVYPDTIAKGWDASLAILPYFELEQAMRQYIDNQQINFEKVGTEFPSVKAETLTYLNADTRHFIDKDTRDLADFNYILQSNAMNDFSSETVIFLQKEWFLEKEMRKGRVYIRLWRKDFKKK